jgi:co-chaperonin GroES (HSP10)
MILNNVQIRAINKDVIVTDMDFGDQKTAAGIIIQSDDGKERGIKPRWAKVYKVGPNQTEYKIGQWVLVQHGRWTRKVKINDGQNDLEIQKVEVESIIAVSNEQITDVLLGKEYDNSPATIRPEEFSR